MSPLLAIIHMYKFMLMFYVTNMNEYGQADIFSPVKDFKAVHKPLFRLEHNQTSVIFQPIKSKNFHHHITHILVSHDHSLRTLFIAPITDTAATMDRHVSHDHPLRTLLIAPITDSKHVTKHIMQICCNKVQESFFYLRWLCVCTDWLICCIVYCFMS